MRVAGGSSLLASSELGRLGLSEDEGSGGAEDLDAGGVHGDEGVLVDGRVVLSRHVLREASWLVSRISVQLEPVVAEIAERPATGQKGGKEQQ